MTPKQIEWIEHGAALQRADKPLARLRIRWKLHVTPNEKHRCAAILWRCGWSLDPTTKLEANVWRVKKIR